MYPKRFGQQLLSTDDRARWWDTWPWLIMKPVMVYHMWLDGETVVWWHDIFQSENCSALPTSKLVEFPECVV